jgi:hypothetical protein
MEVETVENEENVSNNKDKELICNKKDRLRSVKGAGTGWNLFLFQAPQKWRDSKR